MKNKFIFFPVIIFFFIFCSFFYLLVIERDPDGIPSALINKKIPYFQTKSLFNNQDFFSSNEFKNEIIVVNFFATWCEPCLIEHKYIKKLFKNNIKILGINYKDENKKTLDWLKKMGNPYYDVIIDLDGQIAIEWGVYGIPETFIINQNKNIHYRHAGPINNEVYKMLYAKILNLQKN
tara:strand:+ start:914 stop:1447 length:534 start_codon:yes stop_codon:yes gene_type:complete